VKNLAALFLFAAFPKTNNPAQKFLRADRPDQTETQAFRQLLTSGLSHVCLMTVKKVITVTRNCLRHNLQLQLQ
jgi:hypothetical protein